MKFKSILLLYKRSAYRIYFLDEKSSLRQKKTPFIKEEKRRFEKAHDDHYETLRNISKFLFTQGIRFTESYRGRHIDYSRYDLIITVGGDGTFLEAARNAKEQTIVGINSAPGYSVGKLCIGTKDNFKKVLSRLFDQDYSVGFLQRLRVKLDSTPKEILALNDVLICHVNPAFLCRYYLKIGSQKEEQRSSGIWVSTPMGSSGAVYSAGGKSLDRFDKRFQYMPRELYKGINGAYCLRGSVLSKGEKIEVTSLMRKGMIYVDGAHQFVHFEYGANAQIGLSSHPIKTIKL